MRRIEQYKRELPYERAVVIISKRDYRLLLRVVRALDGYMKDRRGNYWNTVTDAMDALNAKPRNP